MYYILCHTLLMNNKCIHFPANKASPPDLAIRRRKCDGGGYIVPL